MSSHMDKPKKKSAETSFREAFERLKRGKSEVLIQGTPVSQNNVAKEAGVDPSALRKARFPSLVAEIQAWVAENNQRAPISPRQQKLADRARNRSLRSRLEIFKAERDHALSLLVVADAKILELTQKNAELEIHLDGIAPSAAITSVRNKSPRKRSD